MVLMKKKTTQHLGLILILGVRGVATIIVNPNMRSTEGQLQLALSLPDTPPRPMPVGEEDIIGT